MSLKEMLESIRRKADVPLSARSLKFLALEPGDMEDFMELHKQQPIRRQVALCTLSGFPRVYATISLFVCLSDGHHLHRHPEEEHR